MSRPLPSAASLLRLLPLALLMGMNSQLPFCNQDPADPTVGNRHRLSDVVVVRPSVSDAPAPEPCSPLTCPLGEEGTLGRPCREEGLCDDGLICSTDDTSGTCEVIPRTYVVLANPEIEQLRIYDAYDRDFLRAPNVFFPLSVRTGPVTRRLAKAPGDDDIVYALDSAADEVFLVRTAPDEDADLPAFTRIGEALDTLRTPGDLAVRRISETEALVYVTIPEDGVLEVIRVDTTTGEEVGERPSPIELGPGSLPADVAVDPSGDAVVVTDGLLSSVAVVQAFPDGAPPTEVDRRIDVGGPTLSVATGRVDPGDGVAPVALVALRDRPEAAVLRLYRPEAREDRYALLGVTELPEVAEVAFVPDQWRDGAVEPQVCCPGLDNADDATLAWALVVSTRGNLIYLRLDAPRGPDGEEPRRGLVRPIDDDPDPPGFAPGGGLSDPNTADNVWFPAGEGPRPEIVLERVDNYGDPPRSPYWPDGLTVNLVYEGSPRGGAGRTGGELAGDELVFDVVNDQDIEVGDTVRIHTEGRPSANCPAEGYFELEIDEVNGERFGFVGDLSAAQLSCLNTGGDFFATFFAEDDFVVSRSDLGYLGRLPLVLDPDQPPPDSELALPGLVLSVQAAGGEPARGGQIILPLDQNLEPLVVELARRQDTSSLTTDGFGSQALVPTGIDGANAWVQPVNEPPRQVRRLFISTAGSLGSREGLLLELNETETGLTGVNSDEL